MELRTGAVLCIGYLEQPIRSTNTAQMSQSMLCHTEAPTTHLLELNSSWFGTHLPFQQLCILIFNLTIDQKNTVFDLF